MTYNVFPTGTTIYDPGNCWNGYTVFQARMFENKSSFAVLIDMNGNVVNQWKGLDGIPNKMLPGGYIMGNSGSRNQKYGFQDQLDLVQVDWDGNIVWRFGRTAARSWGWLFERSGYIPEPPLAAGIVLDCRVQGPGVKIGPELVTHVDLRIADLPEQEIAHPILTGRADQQVGVRQPGRV